MPIRLASLAQGNGERPIRQTQGRRPEQMQCVEGRSRTMKILIIHASAGAGHTKAAEALFNAVQKSSGVQALIVDALDYTNPFYKKIYQKTYALLVTKFPWAWGFFFWLVDLKFLRKTVKCLRRLVNHLNSRPLERFFRREQFDWVFSTHFFSNEVVASLKRKGVIYPQIVSVVTDFDVHSIWLNDGIDYYTAACDWTKEKFLSFGIPAEKILVSGIPTDERFSKEKDKARLRRQLGLQENIFTVLVATGSFGIGPIEKIIQALEDFQVIVVCGHNKALYERLLTIVPPKQQLIREQSSRYWLAQHDLVKKKPVSRPSFKHGKVCGLVNNMDELMAASDCMVTKPGGLSISEALVSSLPLIFFNAIPGQETRNIQVLKRYGIGISDCTIEGMVRQLKKWNSAPELFKEARENTQKLAKPESVSQILKLIHV